MFVFFELMGVVAYALTGYKIEEAQSVHGALSFALINSLGAYVTLTGVALLYARTGELGLAQIGVKLAGKPADALVVAGFVFAITGFIVKAALVPFHFWLADAHAVAPTPVCVLMSGVMVELGLYGMARVYWVVASGTIPGPDFRRAFIVFGTVTAILGAVMCVAQRHLKRLLAFSTISHVGLFCVGIAVLAPEALGGSAIYVVGHAGVKSALFLLTGMLINRYKTVDEGELHGRGRESLSLGVLWMVGGLGLAGLPPFALALGKGLEEHAATTIGYLYTPALFTLASALTGAAVLRAGFRVYFGYGVRAGQRMPGPQMTGPQISGEGQPGQLAAAHEEPETGREVERVPVTMVIPAVALIAGAFALGLYPGFAQACANAAAAFVDRAGYAAHALYTGTPVQPKAAPVQPWTVEGVLLGITSAVLAVGLAAASVWAYRLPRGFITWIRKGEPALRWLHRQHSGHVGDYVAWVVAGVAILAAFIGLPLTH
jgi:multicomponent Na+:H+ antiporter subunit D